MCFRQLLVELLLLPSAQDNRKALSPCLERGVIMQAPGCLCCALYVVQKHTGFGVFFFLKPVNTSCVRAPIQLIRKRSTVLLPVKEQIGRGDN